MAGSLNKVMLIGRLGQDPDVREVGTSTVANFSIATDESYVDRNGNKVEKTEWHRIVMWNKSAETAGRFLRKGSLVLIEGKLETRSWENDAGEKRYSTEIKSFSFQMLDNKKDDIGSSENISLTEKEPITQNSFATKNNEEEVTSPQKEETESSDGNDLPF
tara:strand:+ start:16 stop:498 length:483 start_codon:yes stop_codon:yes gene_type:complete